MNVLYVDHHGRVHRGRLTSRDPAGEDDPQVLRSSAGRPLAPTDVGALLAPAAPTQDQRAGLWQAVQSGYRVEGA